MEGQSIAATGASSLMNLDQKHAAAESGPVTSSVRKRPGSARKESRELLAPAPQRRIC